jgi:hypothetical protein
MTEIEAENRVYRIIFRPEKEVTGGWRKIRNEELSNSYYLQDIVRVMEIKEDEMVLNVACMGQLESLAEY